MENPSVITMFVTLSEFQSITITTKFAIGLCHLSLERLPKMFVFRVHAII